MNEAKTAKCIGVTDIVRINVECPYCEHEMEISYRNFEDVRSISITRQKWRGSLRKPRVCRRVFG